MKLLRAHFRRAAAIAVLLVLLALPIAAAVSLICAYRSNLSDIAERRSAIARFEAIARYAATLDSQAQASPEANHSGLLLPGSDPAIAAASLQAKLKELAQANGLEVTQARDLKPRLVNGLSYVGVAIEMSGAAAGIAELLAAIDAHVPLLIVSKADLRAETSGLDPRYDPIVLYVALEAWGALALPASEVEGGS